MEERALLGVAHSGPIDEPRRYLLEVVEALLARGTAVQVALFGDGPIRAALAAMADVRLIDPLPPRSPAGLAQSAARRLHPALAERVHDLRTVSDRRWMQSPLCVHLHGPRAASLLRYVRTPGVAVTTYVHPYDFSIAGLSPLDRQLLVARTDRFLIADDRALADLLAAGVDPARVAAAPTDLRFPEPPAPPARRAELRTRFGVPDGAFVVAVSAVPDWPSSYDLTVATAWEVQRRTAASAVVRWHWLPPSGGWPWELRYDLDRIRLRHLHLADYGLPPGDLVDLADAVLLSDSTPHPDTTELALESISRGVPLLCWASHPLAAQVAEWNGTLVDQPDVAAMADAVLELARNRPDRAAAIETRRTAVRRQLDRIVPLETTLR